MVRWPVEATKPAQGAGECSIGQYRTIEAWEKYDTITKGGPSIGNELASGMEPIELELVELLLVEY